MGGCFQYFTPSFTLKIVEPNIAGDVVVQGKCQSKCSAILSVMAFSTDDLELAYEV